MDGSVLVPGLTQRGIIANQALITQTIDNANEGIPPPADGARQSLSFVPTYNIASYPDTVQGWIDRAGKPRDQRIKINIADGHTSRWEDYGFSQVGGGAGGGLWPFFYAEVHTNGRTESRTLNTSNRENSFTLELSMIGIQKFDVRPGEWDVPNIKTLFPNRRAGAPNVLSADFALISSVLVGYDVELKVDFAAEMREEVNKIYDEVKSSGGKLSILGFVVSAGGGSSGHVNTKFNDVKWDRNVGTMILTPTKGQVYPTILGAVAQKL